MKKHLFLPLFAVLTFLAMTASRGAEPLVFPNDGFTIEPLDQPPTQVKSKMALMLYMAADNGFAPNVNVMVQAYEGTLDSFRELSKGQFKELGAKIITDKLQGKDTWLLEYGINLQQRDCRCYSRVAWTKGKVYVVTGTSLEADWTRNAAALKKCVESFAVAK